MLPLYCATAPAALTGVRHGCVRASAVDVVPAAFHSMVVREACADGAPGPHCAGFASGTGPFEANPFDLGAKYADVVPLTELLQRLG